jgi:dihydroorotase
MSKTLLKGGRVLNPATGLDAIQDVLIVSGKIEAIGQNLAVDADTEVVLLKASQWVTPGLIDIHVHLRDMGQSSKETIRSGTQAAIAGGFTRLCTMANTNPILDHAMVMDRYTTLIEQTALIPVHLVAAATKNIAGEELTEMAALKNKGAVGYSDDGNCIMDSRVARLVMEYSTMLGQPFICHAEDTHLSAHGCMNEGEVSTLLGLPGIPHESESSIVARDIQLAGLTGAHVHFAHISTAQSVNLIRQAKLEGVHVTAETAPHYLALTDKALLQYNTHAKMNPPLRLQSDCEALKQGLLDGTIDCIATDHAPHTTTEKSQPMDGCPFGVIGLETALAVTLTQLYHTGLATPLQIINWMSTQPAKIMGLPGGSLTVGDVADITVIDPDLSWTVSASDFYSKGRNTPFEGQRVSGQALLVYSAGVEVSAGLSMEASKA